MNPCPCGSGNDYPACCEPIISGRRAAVTAEELMRARYSAHVTAAVDFLYASTHPDHREHYDHKGTRAWAEKSEWLGLDIRGTTAGTAEDTEGVVEFVARFRDKGVIRTHHERGRFRREAGTWFFTEGEMVKAPPLNVTKIGRNDPCRCGSGKKFKKCCGQ